MSEETKVTKGKVGRESYSSVHLHAKRKFKRQEAEARQAKYDALTTEQKLKQAIGQKEIAKLKSRLTAEKAVKALVSPSKPAKTPTKKSVSPKQ